MNKQQLERGCRTIIEKLPEQEFADDLMIEAVRSAVTPEEWINRTPEERTELKRELYRALKAAFDVVDIDDHLTAEDFELLDEVISEIDDWIPDSEKKTKILHLLKEVREP